MELYEKGLTPEEVCAWLREARNGLVILHSRDNIRANSLCTLNRSLIPDNTISKTELVEQDENIIYAYELTKKVWQRIEFSNIESVTIYG